MSSPTYRNWASMPRSVRLAAALRLHSALPYRESVRRADGRVEYQERDLSIVLPPCRCEVGVTDPACLLASGRRAVCVDFVKGSAITFSGECLALAPSLSVWSMARPILVGLGSWEQCMNFYGVPVVALPYALKTFADECFSARDRARTQLESLERGR